MSCTSFTWCGVAVMSIRRKLTVCRRRVSPEGQITTARRAFGTTYAELLVLREWLTVSHCPIVALEASTHES
jgi:hypothetical protein